jgi:hypothetical protein
MLNFTKEQVSSASNSLDELINASREKRKRTQSLDDKMDEFAMYFYRVVEKNRGQGDLSDEDLATRITQTNGYSVLMDMVDEGLTLHPCILHAVRDANGDSIHDTPNYRCVACSKGVCIYVQSEGDHGYKEHTSNLMICKRCAEYLKVTDAVNTGTEVPCSHCGFVHAWMPHTVFGLSVARLADTISSEMHGLTPLGVFFATEALKLFNVDARQGAKLAKFYRTAGVGQVSDSLPPIKLPDPGTRDETKAKALLALVTCHEFFPLCFTSEMPLYGMRNVHRK